MSHVIAVSIVLIMSSREALFSNPILLSETDKTYYKSIVGGLSWFAQSTRWDIISSVSRLQMVGQNPTVGALKCALHVVAYLACTNSFKLGGVRTATNHLRYIMLIVILRVTES